MYGKLAKEFPNLAGIKNTFQDTPLAKQFKDAAPDRQVCRSACLCMASSGVPCCHTLALLLLGFLQQNTS